MSEIATSPNWLHRIRYTPMRDVLRGRFTGRLDVKRLVERSDLPQPAQQLIRRVVGRTRLRVLERSDVANELIAHFADGLESGKTIEQLIASFGNERQAARLIARAKRRNRSLLGRAQTLCGRFCVVLVVIYAAISIYFFTGQSGGVAPFEELNNFSRQFPESQRAWPIYEKIVRDNDGAAMAGAIQIRRAATLPVVGFIVDADCARQAAERQKQLHWTHWPVPDFVYAMSQIWIILIRDTEMAWRSHQPQWFLDDIDAADHLFRQWRDDPAASGVALTLFDQEMEQIDLAVSETPTWLGECELHHLAEQIAAYHTAADLVNLRSEEFEFHKMIAERYTAQGILPRHLSQTAIDQMLDADQFHLVGLMFGKKPSQYLLGPAFSLISPSASDLIRSFNEAQKQAQINLNMPFRLADWNDGAFRRNAAYAEYCLGHRDGVLIGIALELYHRKHNAYPATLAELDRDIVGPTPVDRITGGPLHYRIVDGKPLVYSVGGDRRDDGGRLPLDREGLPDAQAAAIGKADGDWVIYPVPERWKK